MTIPGLRSRGGLGVGLLDGCGVGRIKAAFDEIVELIRAARQRAYQAVNTELVSLYWQIGKYISGKLAAAEWGEGVVDHLAQHLACTLPGLRGFTRRNLFRMRQFFDTYASERKVSSLVTQLPWTHNLIVLGQSKSAVLHPPKLSPAVRQDHAAVFGELRRRVVA